jgi:DNA-binding MarR family transcriptional regulator
MTDKRYKIYGKFQSIMALVKMLENSPRKFGTDKSLSHAEIHLIETIGDNEGLSVTDISRLLGITKGAVSQSLKRLEIKGFSTKEKDPDNLSRAIVKLTAKGMTAFWSHKDWHEKMDGGFSRYMDSLPDKEIDIILDFMSKTEDFLKRRLESKA